MRAIVLELSLLKAGFTLFLSKFSKSAYYGRFSIVKYYKDYPEPRLPDEDWVKVKTKICGICGSDIRLITLSESFYLYPLTSFPLIPGHEIVGVVEEAGKEVKNFQPGDRVVVDPALSCEVRGLELCEACRKGHTASCSNTDRGKISPGIFTGICRDTAGGWAEYFLAHESQLIKVPDDIKDENAVFAEPLSIGIHSALRSFPSEDQKVAVVGCGIIGLATIYALRHLGFSGEIWGIEKNEKLISIAKNFGADEVIVGDPIEEIANLTGGRVYKPPRGGKLFVGGGVDTVFECVGTAEAVDTALRIVKPLGNVVVAGTVSKVCLDLAPIFSKELKIIGTFGCGYEEVNGKRRTFDIAIEILKKKDFSELLTHIFSIEEYKKALWSAINKKKSGAIKVAFKF
ncbi:MAG: zinc-binding dehydrogenase [Archaeoglobaceae archaeon]|nr:zinc-binding dehydrogenase [Archaeoglobaceae archaeon]MDW8117807.1 zinc-binding dehydrogenase [Archaeoglobaceae archaeon]